MSGICQASRSDGLNGRPCTWARKSWTEASAVTSTAILAAPPAGRSTVPCNKRTRPLPEVQVVDRHLDRPPLLPGPIVQGLPGDDRVGPAPIVDVRAIFLDDVRTDLPRAKSMAIESRALALARLGSARRGSRSAFVGVRASRRSVGPDSRSEREVRARVRELDGGACPCPRRTHPPRRAGCSGDDPGRAR